MTGLTVCKTEDQVAISLEIMMEEYDKYFSAHGLKINVAKCEHIVMGARRTRKVVINGREEATEVPPPTYQDTFERVQLEGLTRFSQ